jgi:hypothetical protein
MGKAAPLNYPARDSSRPVPAAWPELSGGGNRMLSGRIIMHNAQLSAIRYPLFLKRVRA